MEENNNYKKFIIGIGIIILVIIIIIGITKPNKEKENKGNQAAANNTTKQETNSGIDLSFKFLKMDNKKENMIYSPLSIKYALAMLNEGADRNTKTQIENVIGNTTLKKYENINDVLSLANVIYIRDSYSESVKDEYKNKLVNDYNAEIKYDAFKSAKNINNWIENKTFGQIKNMLQDEMVTNQNNRMILINALAIDMEWNTQFEGKNTRGRKFYLEDGSEMTATTMNLETKSNSVSYYTDDEITAISMDLKEYDNQQMEFIAIMPNKDLSNYIENFDENTLKKITDNLTLASKTKYGLDIYVPKFSFEYDLDLEKDLKQLGITDAFNPDLADFTNMSRGLMWVGGALHKANIDFTEKGVKAAAVTVVLMAEGVAWGDERKPIEININKPFMYIIRDKKTNEIWFVGTVYKPNSWQDDKSDYELY